MHPKLSAGSYFQLTLVLRKYVEKPLEVKMLWKGGHIREAGCVIYV